MRLLPYHLQLRVLEGTLFPSFLEAVRKGAH
jgi:hypothetical protein